MEERKDEKGVPLRVQNEREPLANPPVPAPIKRVEKGKFAKGYSANPSGRSRATAKKIERLKSYMDLALSDRWPRFLAELDTLTGKDFVTAYKDILEFRFPKLARLDATSVNSNKVVIQVQHSADANLEPLFPDNNIEDTDFKIVPNE